MSMVDEATPQRVPGHELEAASTSTPTSWTGPHRPSPRAPCPVSRARTRRARQVTPGGYGLVVDTFVSSGTPKGGALGLAVEPTVLDAWQVVELAPMAAAPRASDLATSSSTAS